MIWCSPRRLHRVTTAAILHGVLGVLCAAQLWLVWFIFDLSNPVSIVSTFFALILGVLSESGTFRRASRIHSDGRPRSRRRRNRQTPGGPACASPPRIAAGFRGRPPGSTLAHTAMTGRTGGRPPGPRRAAVMAGCMSGY